MVVEINQIKLTSIQWISVTTPGVRYWKKFNKKKTNQYSAIQFETMSLQEIFLIEPKWIDDSIKYSFLSALLINTCLKYLISSSNTSRLFPNTFHVRISSFKNFRITLLSQWGRGRWQHERERRKNTSAGFFSFLEVLTQFSTSWWKQFRPIRPSCWKKNPTNGLNRIEDILVDFRKRFTKNSLSLTILNESDLSTQRVTSEVYWTMNYFIIVRCLINKAIYQIEK